MICSSNTIFSIKRVLVLSLGALALSLTGAGPAASGETQLDALRGRAQAALARRDAAAAATAALDLDEAIVGWSTDTLQSDETDRARALLRSMIVRLGDAAVGGLADPRTVLGPVVDVALAARIEVRAPTQLGFSLVPSTRQTHVA
jgi:hypothetical protein